MNIRFREHPSTRVSPALRITVAVKTREHKLLWSQPYALLEGLAEGGIQPVKNVRAKKNIFVMSFEHHESFREAHARSSKSQNKNHHSKVDIRELLRFMMVANPSRWSRICLLFYGEEQEGR